MPTSKGKYVWSAKTRIVSSRYKILQQRRSVLDSDWLPAVINENADTMMTQIDHHAMLAIACSTIQRTKNTYLSRNQVSVQPLVIDLDSVQLSPHKRLSNVEHFFKIHVWIAPRLRITLATERHRGYAFDVTSVGHSRWSRQEIPSQCSFRFPCGQISLTYLYVSKISIESLSERLTNVKTSYKNCTLVQYYMRGAKKGQNYFINLTEKAECCTSVGQEVVTTFSKSRHRRNTTTILTHRSICLESQAPDDPQADSSASGLHKTMLKLTLELYVLGHYTGRLHLVSPQHRFDHVMT